MTVDEFKSSCREALNKQMELLAKCSEQCAENCDAQGLAVLTEQMAQIVHWFVLD